MKKNAIFIFLLILLCLTSCDTVTYYTIKVSLDRHPTLTVINQTGHPVAVTAPVSANINNGARTQYQPHETNQNINVTYTINRISFTEQVTWNNADATVTLTKRPPTITVVNQTGRMVSITAPVSLNLANGDNTNFLPTVLNQNINISYRVGQMNLTEQVIVGNQDVNVVLTRSPPTIIVVNNVGTTINMIWLRLPNVLEWTGGNIVTREGEIYLIATQALAGQLTGSIVNRDSVRIWMGNIPISGDRFDIRITDVNNVDYVKSNVQIRSDMTLTFTQSDKR